MIVTSDVLVFASIDSPEKSTVLDAIPMFQIDEIHFWDSNGNPRSEEEIQGIKQNVRIGISSADIEAKKKNGSSKSMGGIRHDTMWQSTRKWCFPSLNASIYP